MPKNYVMLYQHFRDFDAFVNCIGDVDKIMMLQNPEQFSWSLMNVDLSGINVQIGLEGGGNITEGQSRSDGYIIFVSLNLASMYTLNGKAFENNSFAILEPECEFCLRCSYKHDWCSIFIPSHKLIRDGVLGESTGDSQKKVSRITQPNYQLVKQFLNVVYPIMNTASHCSNFESSTAATYATEQLLKLAPLIIGQQQTDKLYLGGRPKFSRQEIILRFKSFLEERCGKPISVKELATALKVSEGTLWNVFNEYFGVSPLRYLQLRQLHQVYRALRVAEPQKVAATDILLEKGVWDLPRFTSQYRQVFGQVPSQTLRAEPGDAPILLG